METTLNFSRCLRSVTLGAGPCQLEDFSRLNNSITCSSLQEVLSLLSSVGSARIKGRRESCTEIVLGEMDQVVRRTLSLNENVVLKGGGTEKVTVRLVKSSLAFVGADYVEIEGIHFISSDGAAVSFDKVTCVYMINSSFR